MSPSIWQLLIVLAIVLVLFGAKRLRSLGSDLGGAVKGFKSAMREEEEKDESGEGSSDSPGRLGGSQDAGDHRFEGEQESEPSKRHGD